MFKTIVTFVAGCAMFASVAQAQDKAERDENFFQGMEQGFFLRNDLDGYKQFSCPELRTD